ncbi:MAG: hypothetical protein JWR84_1722 [Caulobacter sp.]|nr:hypothetical protein [Caulobacter sp.]
MATALDKRLTDLRHRVTQLMNYQKVSSPGTAAVISHFTPWEGCHGMLQDVRNRRGRGFASGLRLWAGDSNCLNDPLEGRELLRFAEAVVEPSRLALDLQPHYVSGRWPRYPIGDAPPDAGDSEDTPSLPVDEWEKLSRVLATLYRLPPLQIAGSTEPLTVASKVHLVSFCRERDRLDLWRTYGEKGTGVCMAMPLSRALASVTETGWGFYYVAYDERSKARAWALLINPLYSIFELILQETDNSKRGAIIDRTLNEIRPALFLFKHEQYRSEREIRLLYTGNRPPEIVLDGAKAVVKTQAFFLGGTGCSVILGPTMKDRSFRAAVLNVELSKAFGANAPIVQLSRAPYQ